MYETFEHFSDATNLDPHHGYVRHVSQTETETSWMLANNGPCMDTILIGYPHRCHRFPLYPYRRHCYFLSHNCGLSKG